MKIFRAVVLSCAIGLVCGGTVVAKPRPVAKKAAVAWHVLPGGLKYDDLKIGKGASPKSGQQVTVQYTGWLMNGTKFDSSRDRHQPFTFTIGEGQVIKGWDEGVSGMKVGGRRILVIPPTLGYGSTGTPGGPIPPNATLKFDVELLGVK
ncbi:MAG: FKBP-type peptidyl-prolyl cis-trans isomerase [Cyanobacteria bacterium REEB65]|nr:FKBP-type peptidyl-prolyl cis-trans isomerase [Cyanobacteria bacterium REEB65]